MKSFFIKTWIVFTILASLLVVLPACQPAVTAASYVALAPKILHSSRMEAISVALFNGAQPAKDVVTVSILKDKETIASTVAVINGKGKVNLDIPDVADGAYELQVKSSKFTDKTTINIEKSYLAFVETDKPIYKPGQTIHVRVMTLDPDLKPVSEAATVEITDAKSIKIFREVVQTDEYGMADVDLPLSSEPNLGVWKINITTEKAKSELDVRVEEYVLPKYEVAVTLPKEWFLVSEKITGTVNSTYTFGKPVEGEMKIEALKYVGQWQTYATITKNISGNADFEIPAAGYVAGTPASGGDGNVQLNITVTEKSTGYVEKTSRLLTVADSAVNLQVIPEGTVFKPGLPFSFLIVTETPGSTPVDAVVETTVTYVNDKFEDFQTDKRTINTTKGTGVLEISPPAAAIAMIIEATSGTAYATKNLQASYSPSGNFIHLEQVTEGSIAVGQKIAFRVYSTDTATNFYYEVVARGTVAFSDYSRSRDISFSTTPLMTPDAKILVYQILPNSEVAADYLPFTVAAAYPQQVVAGFDTAEAKPADEVQINIQTEGPAKVGIAAVDKSVFILAENRLNLQQVFAELERLYMDPQAEIDQISFYPTVTTVGTTDVFKDAGMVVMTNQTIPQSKDYQVQPANNSFWNKIFRFFGGRNVFGGIAMEDANGAKGGVVPPMVVPAPTQTTASGSSSLAEVQRVRQFFPETWLWTEVTTDASGKASQTVTVPDTITTWKLRAVAVSKENGLGVAENELKVFQPFFLSIDLPYSAIRGEEFPVSVAIYNYLDTAQNVQVDITQGDWFELLDNASQTVNIAPNEIGSVQFRIRPGKIGIKELKISARSAAAADAVIKTIIIEPEGVDREIVDNITLAGGVTKTLDTSLPDVVVADSGRAYIAVTSSFLTQTLDGLDSLLQMPFGCGEQNMLNFAPDVFITKYLEASGQLKPEIMAKAEMLMITGYQRELTYRRTDGSFSAFGMNDESGSLWLTAFVLKSFSQAKNTIYIDDGILSAARNWITSHQNADGSFDAVGFVHHQEMIGGLQGKDALTAYVAIALLEAGDTVASGRAVQYLETKLALMDSPYEVALTTYALEKAKSSKAGDAYTKLMALAKEDENGLHWGADEIIPVDTQPAGKVGAQPFMRPYQPDINREASIETTAYATLALVQRGDALNASRAAKWLVSKRNAYGGYGSTQDTVVTLQALTEFAVNSRADVDLTVTLKGAGIDKTLAINASNFDVLQTVEVGINGQITMTVTGKGDAIGQLVRRYNVPAADATPAAQMLKVDVTYDTTEVEVNDLVNVNVNLGFNPLPELNIAEAGMIVVDVSIPTGFEAVRDSIVAITEQMPNIKRFEIAGRKVIFYVENMKPGDKIAYRFQVKALYPVKAKGVMTSAYSYYTPDIKGETLSAAVTVR
ncbi:MAG: alpha-2-macroglobulin family protein [Dehalococcoidales bacterium]|nr:alpha-2-macroglobulin family protein [Dehalococcoidales bacterium]